MKLPPKITAHRFDRLDLMHAIHFGKWKADAREMRDQGYRVTARFCARQAREAYEQIAAKHEGVVA